MSIELRLALVAMLHLAVLLCTLVAQPAGDAKVLVWTVLALSAGFLAIHRSPGFLSLLWIFHAMTCSAIAIMSLGPTPARAEAAGAAPSRVATCWHCDDRQVRKPRPARKVQARKVWRQHRIHEDRCKPPLAIVGDQFVTESGAQGEADKAWMQTARWQWGERYMARENADDATYECGRSSVGSAVGQVFYRCRLTARPCRPEAKEGEK